MFEIILTSDPHRTPYTISKSLLASLSPEFRQHIYSPMLEGSSNRMLLDDVEPETLTLFLQWINNLTTESAIPSTLPGLVEKGGLAPNPLPWAKLYVFADRFNVAGLLTHCLCTISTILMTRLITQLPVPGSPKCFRNGIAPQHLPLVFGTVIYAYENLPPRSMGKTEPLRGFLAEYGAWTLADLRNAKEWVEIVERVPEFAVGVLGVVGAIGRRPEIPQVISPLGWEMTQMVGGRRGYAGCLADGKWSPGESESGDRGSATSEENAEEEDEEDSDSGWDSDW